MIDLCLKRARLRNARLCTGCVFWGESEHNLALWLAGRSLGKTDAVVLKGAS